MTREGPEVPKPGKPKRPGHATVVAYLALFVAIGGSAYAAVQLPKNSVGTRELKKKAVGTSQLKGNAVTKNKVKKNTIVTNKIRGGAVVRGKIHNTAVNGAKIAGNAVTGPKIADNSVQGSDIDAPSTPFSRIVHEARGGGTLNIPKEDPGIYPLANAIYTQEPGRDDVYYGAADITFKATCTSPRQAVTFIVIDPANPAEPSTNDIVGYGLIQDEGAGEASVRVKVGPSEIGGVMLQRDVPVTHTLYMGTQVGCSAGEGATMTYGAIDVIGTK